MPAKTLASRPLPKQERSLQTYDLLLNVAGELLAEVGIESISTNMICERAGMTPPALYRYFRNKYDILGALGRRLMDRQNAVLVAWLEKNGPLGLKALGDAHEQLLRDTAAVTRSEPGAVWVLRAMRAVPQLSHVRLESHRKMTDAQFEVFSRLLPHMNKRKLRQRLRLAIELAYAVDEMLADAPEIPDSTVIRETARILKYAVIDPSERHLIPRQK